MRVAGSTELRVLVVGPDLVARAGLAALLDQDLEVVESLPEDADLALSVERYRVDAIVWDLQQSLPRRERIEELGAPVLALVETVDEARAALGLGIQGVLHRDRVKALVSWTRALVEDALLVDLELAPGLLRAAPSLRVAPLTPREVEVLDLLSEGLSNRQIARALGVSEHTAKFHVNALLGKLGASTRTEAVVNAARAGLLDL